MSLIVFVLLTLAGGVVGAWFPPGDWYAGLTKPELTPPNAWFAPVWTTLYLTIAVAAWLLWRSAPSRRRNLALALFGVQLVLNAAWSWLAFGRHELGLAFVDLAALFVVIVGWIAVSFGVRRAAALLLLPYALWVGFAGWLNLGLWRLNG